MTQPNRRPQGGRIDRKRPLEFTFNGKPLMGYAGDTLASALIANDVNVVGRSFKYHRPRGILAAGVEEPNAILQVNEGPRTIPNARATMVDLVEGMSARTVNAWPSPNFDLMAVNSRLSRLMPAGFYYKTFMWPARLWMTYEHFIRKAAGLGLAPTEPDPDWYEKTNAHCEVLVVGAGPAGLAAAVAAGRAGARVILADENAELGASLFSSQAIIDGQPASEWREKLLQELAQMPEVRLLPRSTVFGYYDHNFLAIAERCTDHLPAALASGPRERLWRVRARQVVIATGSHERTLAFPNNDRPGVMLAGSVSTYIHRYGVLPGQKALVFTNNDSAYQTALDLAMAGAQVQVVDVRSQPNGQLPQQVRAAGIPIHDGQVVVNTQYGSRLEGAKLMVLDGDRVTGQPRGEACDLLAVSGGWNPAVHLHAHSGARPVWDEAQACFVPGQSVQAERSVGACAGQFSLSACLSAGFKAGAMAAHVAGHCDGIGPPVPPVEEPDHAPIKPCWLVPGPKPIAREGKRFLDLQNDATAADIKLAVREGFRSIEHIKRYTALGFGTDQGKTGNINGMAILADTLGQSIPATGTTTFRPAYTPVTFGVMAGREHRDLLDPIRKTALHRWHEEQGALFEDVGQWKRPWYYPKPGESLHDAVNRECLAVRNGVGILDATTLGKIDIQGPDAAEFLGRVTVNPWKKLAIGRCRYGLMLSEDGMVMDDGVTTRLGENHFLMTTTTSGAAAVLAHLERWLQTEWPDLKVYLTSVTDHWATLAVPGPKSREVVAAISEGIDFSNEAFPFMSYREGSVAGVAARVMRISFSGELAYEINIPANHARQVWEALMKAGETHGITPYGTETMHVLRAEKGYVIVGQDTDGSVTPVDLGMGGMLKKGDFIGKRSLVRSDTVRTDRKQLVGLLTEDPMLVLPEGGQIIDPPTNRPPPVPMLGHVTSSYWSATLDRSIALAVVKNGHQRLGEAVYIPLLNGKSAKAIISSSVFYDPEGKRLHG